jgi:hypothetical protein
MNFSSKFDWPILNHYQGERLHRVAMPVEALNWFDFLVGAAIGVIGSWSIVQPRVCTVSGVLRSAPKTTMVLCFAAFWKGRFHRDYEGALPLQLLITACRALETWF